MGLEHYAEHHKLLFDDCFQCYILSILFIILRLTRLNYLHNYLA